MYRCEGWSEYSVTSGLSLPLISALDKDLCRLRARVSRDSLCRHRELVSPEKACVANIRVNCDNDDDVEVAVVVDDVM